MPGNEIPGLGKSAPVQPVIARAYPAVLEKPQFLQGKMTFLGLILTTVGMIGKTFGLNLPTDEAGDFMTWLAANWDSLAQGVGILVAAYGRLRARPR